MMFYLGIDMQDAIITYLNIEKKNSHGPRDKGKFWSIVKNFIWPFKWNKYRVAS